MMKKIIIASLLSIIVACGRKAPPLSQGFSSIQDLVTYHLNCIQTNDRKSFEARLITQREFHDSVYPYLPEANKKIGGITEEDYWAWTIPDRIKAARAVFARFGGARLVKLTISDPKKTISLGAIKLHRDIGIYADFENKGEKTIHALITTDLFKAIVEVNGEFKLLNMTFE